MSAIDEPRWMWRFLMLDLVLDIAYRVGVPTHQVEACRKRQTQLLEAIKARH
jgi:hypothetical protein